MIQQGLTVGLLEVNCYIIGDEETKEAVVIDPGGDEDEILEALNHHQLKLKYIIGSCSVKITAIAGCKCTQGHLAIASTAKIMQSRVCAG